MNRLLALAVALCLSPIGMAQVVDANACDILKNPSSFNNKLVRLKGTISAGLDHFILQAPDCGLAVNAIWLQYPEGAKAKSGPLAVLVLQPALNFSGKVEPVPTRIPITLDKNKDFKQFDSLLSTPLKTNGTCLGCERNLVDATLVGRIDTETPALQRDAQGKIVAISGFGNLNAYSTRLVLQAVSDVVAHEIDAAKAATITGSDPDSVASRRVSETVASTIALPDHPKRAIKAWGEPGDDNGVNITFSAPAEIPASLEAQGPAKSPDGVLYQCIFNSERLKDETLQRALTHMGEHIADLRTPEETILHASLYQLEYRAWISTLLGAITSGQKSLQIPGGYQIWNSSWTTTNLNTNTDAALREFFTHQELLTK